MDWENRNVAVLFGDGCAAVILEATVQPEGLLGEALGCSADARESLRVRGIGCAYANRGIVFGDTHLFSATGPADFLHLRGFFGDDRGMAVGLHEQQ